ncbi:MAG: hypothetical protein ACR2G2_16020 [Pseudonocardia sp.]
MTGPGLTDTAEFQPPAERATQAWRWDLLALLCGAALVVASAFEGRRLLAAGVNIFLGFPPLLASWMPHFGPGTVPAIATAATVVIWGPRLAHRLRWRTLLLTGWAAAAVWTTSLALVDGWQDGVAGRLTTDQEYLFDLPRAPTIAGMLHEFTARMPTDQPVHWTTHVGGHPPGAFLVFLVLDRLGLTGGGPAALFCILVGSSAVAAVAVTLRCCVGAETLARQVLPFSVLFPGAIWVGVSADGMFAGVLAWAAALLALGATHRGRWADLAALGAGLLFGYTLYLSYGLLLGGCLIPAVILGLKAADRRTRPVLIGGAGVGAVGLAFTAAGFWWPTGFEILRMLYAASIAKSRPYEYFWWTNLAACAFVLGPAVLVGLCRVARSPRALPLPAVLLTSAGLVAILAADISGLSKGEVERIWLPFAVWLVVGTASLPANQRRAWLAAQATLTLLVNHLLFTVW